MHGITGIEDADDLLAVAVDQRHLAGIAQGHREEVVQIELVQLLGRPVLDRHIDLPAVANFLHAEFGRRRRLVLQEARHDVDVFSVISPEVPQFGMPPGEPNLISAFRYSVPRAG